MGLDRIEKRLERLVEGAFAKAFGGAVHPVELCRRLVREMDLGRTLGVRATLAPNHFTITFSPADRERLAAIDHMLVQELTEAARQHARTERYRLPGPLVVELATDPAIPPGAFRLSAELREGHPTAALVLFDGTRIAIGDEPVVVGRAGDCDLVLSDPTVSKHHAELRWQGSDVIVIDLGSTNGTRVNSAGIKEHRLVDGDEIHLGTTVLRYEAG